jgi:hypothetical protein
MILAGYVTCMKGRDHIEDLDMDGRIILIFNLLILNTCLLGGDGQILNWVLQY